jgi:hypothetical protein
VRTVRGWTVIVWSLLICGACRHWQQQWKQAPTLPVRHSVVLGQLVVYSDFQLPRQHRLLEELSALRADVSTRLDVPISDEPIHVYLFQSQDDFKQFMTHHYPDFPPRRAFFVETDTRLNVYASWGDRVAEDLRHEVSHGYMHAVVPHLPLWLDEGLAEYFEVPRGRSGLHRQHLEDLLDLDAKGTWKPNLERLAQMNDIAQMNQLDYAESWAWAHLLIESTPNRRGLLRNYLAGLRRDGSAAPLAPRLRAAEPEIDRWLVEHLHRLRDRR